MMREAVEVRCNIAMPSWITATGAGIYRIMTHVRPMQADVEIHLNADLQLFKRFMAFLSASARCPGAISGLFNRILASSAR